MIGEEDGVDPFNIRVHPEEFAVQVEPGKVGARRGDTQLAEDLGNQLLAEQAAKLHAVVESHASQSKEPLPLLEFVELDQETAFVLLLRP